MRVSYETLRKWTAVDGLTVSTPVGDDQYEIDHAASAKRDLAEIPKNLANIFTLNHIRGLDNVEREYFVLGPLMRAIGTPVAFETKGTVREARGLTSIT